jgi:hypothetical protein
MFMGNGGWYAFPESQYEYERNHNLGKLGSCREVMSDDPISGLWNRYE